MSDPAARPPTTREAAPDLDLGPSPTTTSRVPVQPEHGREPATRPAAEAATTATTAAAARPPATTAGQRVEPAHSTGAIGWLLMTAAAVLLLVGTWNIYPTDEAGMWAGYRDQLLALVVLVVSMVLYGPLRPRPWLLLAGLAGVALVAEAVFWDSVTAIWVVEAMAGGAILLGVALRLSDDG